MRAHSGQRVFGQNDRRLEGGRGGAYVERRHAQRIVVRRGRNLQFLVRQSQQVHARRRRFPVHKPFLRRRYFLVGLRA